MKVNQAVPIIQSSHRNSQKIKRTFVRHMYLAEPESLPERDRQSQFRLTRTTTNALLQRYRYTIIRPLRIPAIPTDFPIISSVFQSQSPIVDRNRLVSVFLHDAIHLDVHPNGNRVHALCANVPAMNGGEVISPRALYQRFGETVGKVSGVDWLFGLDETDPWVKTYVFVHSPRTIARSVYLLPHSWRANSNVVRNRLRSPRRKIDNLTVHRYFMRLTSSTSCQNG